MESIEDKLNELQKNWKDAESIGDYHKKDELPEGIYVAAITDAKLTTSKSQIPMLVFEMTVQEGRYEDWKHNVYCLLNDKGIKYTKQKVEATQVVCESPADLVPIIKSGKFIGIIMQIKIQVYNGITNTYFQKRIDVEADDTDEVPIKEKDEKTPW